MAILAAGLGVSAPAAAAPRVVASIKPVHALVAAVMAGVGDPRLLVPGAASVHTYNMRPSDAEALAGADVVFWIGPGFEVFLEKPLAQAGGIGDRLMAAPGMTVLPARRGGLWDADEDEAAGSPDGHLWLDPANAKAMTAEIARRLSALDPDHAALYAKNAAAADADIDGLDAELRRTLAPVKERPFIVFHDAYQYFDRHYGLAAAGAVTVAPDRPPGARRIAAIKARMGADKIVCVFSEPQFPPRLVDMLVEGTDARQGTLDPEGSTLPPGPGLYAALMRNLAQALAGCLKG